MKGKKLFLYFGIDVLLVGIGLVLFALFHHVIDFSPKAEPVEIVDVAELETADAAPVPSAEPSPTETPEIEEAPRPLTWREKFAGKFTNGAVVQTADFYASENINVSFSRIENDGIVYHLADIYIADIRNFATNFSYREYLAKSERLIDKAHIGTLLHRPFAHFYGALGA